jgi:hypothetical protein
MQLYTVPKQQTEVFTHASDTGKKEANTTCDPDKQGVVLATSLIDVLCLTLLPSTDQLGDTSTKT